MAGDFAVSIPGGSLSGERRGTGAPLILIHGMAGTRHEWDGLWSALPPDQPLLRYDLRGFGQSTADESLPYSHSDDLLALFDSLDIARAPLLGLSMGGSVALNFALSHPERVSCLTLISPAMIGWEWSDEWKAIWRDVARAAKSGDMASARERWWQHPMFAKLRESEAAGHFREALQAYPGRQWIADPQRPELPDIDRLHALAAPTLLMTGSEDFSDMRLIADLIEATAPNLTRIDHADTGHMVHLERPGETAQAIRDFLAVNARS